MSKLLDFRPPTKRGRRYATVHNLHHILAYNLAGAGNDTFADSTAFPDQSFSQRNGHYIFSEDYNLIVSNVFGTNASDGRLNMPSINAIGFHHLWGVNRSATIPTPVVIEDNRDSPIALPKWEEMSVQLSDNVAGAQNVTALLIVGAPSWSTRIPSGLAHLTVKATAAITTGALAWAGLTPLIFESTLKGGWYSVVGMDVVGANLLAFQMNFPRFPLINGRKFYPGLWSINAIGNYPVFYDRDWMGWWGYFHTVEPPQIQGFSVAGGAINITAYIDLVYHGDGPPTMPPPLSA